MPERTPLPDVPFPSGRTSITHARLLEETQDFKNTSCRLCAHFITIEESPNPQHMGRKLGDSVRRYSPRLWLV